MPVSNFFIQSELQWLDNIIKARVMFPNEDLRNFDIVNNQKFISAMSLSGDKNDYSISLPTIQESSGFYTAMIGEYSFEERLLLILAIANDISPCFIDRQIAKIGIGNTLDKDPNWLKTIGLVVKNNYGFVPTMWFFIYLLSGQNLSLRLQIMNAIRENDYLPLKDALVNYSGVDEHEPVYGGIIWVEKNVVLDLLFN